MQKINFKNLPSTDTPIDATNLNLMQDNIETAINSIELSGGGDEVGTVKMFSGSTAPQGWLICDGSAISRTEYAELFSAIGTTYGSGNGTTTFNIPNIEGRTVVGLDSNDTDFNALGKIGGSKELQEHTHNNRMDTLNNLDQSYGLSSNGVYADRVVIRSNSTNSNTLNSEKNIQDTGTGDSGNLQPYIVLNYIIKASATTTTQGQIIDSLDGDSTTDAPSVHAVNEKIDEITTPSYCVATITSSQTIPGAFTINLNKIERSQGNFTLENGVIKIGSGISKVRVSGSIFVDGWAGGNNYSWGKIFKNTNSVATVLASGTSSYISSPIPNTIIDVSEGDVIKLYADTPSGNVRSGADNTWLCVEKVE